MNNRTASGAVSAHRLRYSQLFTPSFCAAEEMAGVTDNSVEKTPSTLYRYGGAKRRGLLFCYSIHPRTKTGEACLSAVGYSGDKTIICPICGVAVIGERSFLPHFLACRRCSGHFLTSQSAQAEYPAQYFSESRSATFISHLARPLLYLLFSLRIWKVRSLLKNTSSPRVLDYGAGNGRLVAALRKRGIDAVGYDPSPAAAASAKEQEIPVFSILSETLRMPEMLRKPEAPRKLARSLQFAGVTSDAPGRYNLVTFWHSLEHVDEPLDALRAIKPFLAPQARLLIAVPNAASWEAKIAGSRWFHYDYPFHRVHFTPQAVLAMLRAGGFRLEKIHFFTPEYTVSGLAQTFLNLFLPKNALYSAVAHRRQQYSPAVLGGLAVTSLAMLIAALPLLAAVYLAQLIFRRTGAMVVVARSV